MLAVLYKIKHQICLFDMYQIRIDYGGHSSVLFHGIACYEYSENIAHFLE